MDNFDYTFLGRSKSRRLSYKAMGWEEVTKASVPALPGIDSSVDVMEEAFDIGDE